jgi:hypothetical protein
VAPYESGRRLCLLFEAGSCRFAVEATSVTEVAEPDPDGRTLRGSLELKDLSVLLGGAAEARPGTAVVLDVSPTLALRVSRVLEVVDVAGDRLFGIPPSLREALTGVSRGALLHGERLFLELVPEAVPHLPPERPSPPTRAICLLERAPDRGLVFESQGVLWGVPLQVVSQIVARTEAFCPLPTPHPNLAGLFPHEQALWPILSAPALMGGAPHAEELFVLAELAGEPAGLAASRVVGVCERFDPTDRRGEFIAAGADRPVLFLDYQSMFS